MGGAQGKRKKQENKPLHIPDREDEKKLAGKPRGYVIGWNKVKRKLGSKG